MNRQWYLEGACIDNPDFVDFPSLKDTRVIATSKAICDKCPVQQECWADAYAGHIDEGIFGGALPSERRLVGALLRIPPLSTADYIVSMLKS
jgi:hypothetical protein